MDSEFAQRKQVPSIACLYRVPDRLVSLLPHLTPGRTLHVIDIENLIGGPKTASSTVHNASEQYRKAFPIRGDDLVVVAANPGLAIEVWRQWKGCQLRFRNGANGADTALLESIADAEEIASRFDRVVIGSGDGIFTGAVVAIRAKGIAVGVVGRANRISRILARSATFVTAIDQLPLTLDAA